MKRLGKFLQLSRSRRPSAQRCAVLGAIRLEAVAVAISDLARRLLIADHGEETVAGTGLRQSRWAVELVSRYMPGVNLLARALAAGATSRYSHQAPSASVLRHSQKERLQTRAW